MHQMKSVEANLKRLFFSQQEISLGKTMKIIKKRDFWGEKMGIFLWKNRDNMQ